MSQADVVMIAFNPDEVLVDAVRTLNENSNGVNRLILIDNCSTNKTNIMRVAGQVDLLITLKQQVSLAEAWNHGISYTNTDYVVITNDDIIFTENWMPPLIEALDNDPKLGVVQPFNTLSGIPAGFPNNYTKEDKIDDVPKSNFVGCCFMVRKSMLPEIKEYDKKMWPEDWEGYSYFYSPYFPIGAEDQDFLLRVKNIGYEVKTAFNSYVHHYSGKTTGHMPEFEEYKLKNNDKFVARWNGLPMYYNFLEEEQNAAA